MSIPSGPVVEDEDQEEQPEANLEPAHHPIAPPDEFFDIPTTVDPSYIISLIRKLLPVDSMNDCKPSEIDAHEGSAQQSKADGMEENEAPILEKGASNGPSSEAEPMDASSDFDPTGIEGRDGGSQGKKCKSVQEELWEENGCILWDLAASSTHAELMVQNFILEVLLGNLLIFQPDRTKEIILGILGNISCHEVPRKLIASVNGLIPAIVQQLFLEDTPCLCEAFRVLTLGLQDTECLTWTEVLQSSDILSRVLWIAENALNPQLLEKSVGLLLAILENQQENTADLLPPLMQLGLPSLLISLLNFEISKLIQERVPERYCVLDLILRAIEALSVIDDHSREISSNRELIPLLTDLIKFPDKAEVPNSCVSAAVLIANILTDVADLAAEISQDLSFLQGLFDVFSFASDDIEARSAIWSTIGRLLGLGQGSQLSASKICQYVTVLVNKSEEIEDELLDHQLENCGAAAYLTSRTMALRKITSILREWSVAKEAVRETNPVADDHVDDGAVNRLLDCCSKYIESDAGS